MEKRLIEDPLTSLLESPYRSAAVKELCTICRAPALVRCPACGRLFCSQHGSFAECCSDCAIELARIERRAGCVYATAIAIPTVAGMGSALSYLGLDLLPVLVFSSFFAGTVFIPVIFMLARRIAKRRFLQRSGQPELLVEGAAISIAPSSPEDEIEVIERRTGWEIHERGEIQRTLYERYMGPWGC
jgi:hypothetical protein